MTKLSANAQKVAEARYFRNSEDNWDDLCKRVSTKISSNEEKSKSGYWQERFFDELSNMRMIAGGRTLRNAGYSNKLLNCHVLELSDSIDSIGRFMHKALVLNAEGGGVGCCPQLRPKGALIKGKGGKSSGLLSFLKAISSVLNTVESGGNRRSGLLPILPITHPETLDFINSKLQQGKLSNFNISVGITNEFLDAVEQKSKWKFTFDNEEYGEIWAPDLFDKIVLNMIAGGEPGLVNLDRMKINNSWYFSPIHALNLCGELPLSPDQSCCLGSLVLPSFLDGSKTKWDDLAETISILVRFLDDVLDVNEYAFPEMERSTMSCRRIGVGVIGYYDYLFAKKVRYGSERGLNKTEELVRFIRNETYKSSIELAKEKGSFSGYNDWTYSKAKFIKTLPAQIRMGIKKHGIRNCTSMAFAPGGTISLIADVGSGIEPLFSKAYRRKDRTGERIYINPLYKEHLKNGEEIPNWLVDSLDLSAEEHFETTTTIQKLNDGSISKTQNIPANTSPKQLKDWLLEYARDLIGITVYADQSRDNQILNSIPEKEVKQIIKEEREVSDSIFEEEASCKSGVCDI